MAVVGAARLVLAGDVRGGVRACDHAEALINALLQEAAEQQAEAVVVRTTALPSSVTVADTCQTGVICFKRCWKLNRSDLFQAHTLC